MSRDVRADPKASARRSSADGIAPKVAERRRELGLRVSELARTVGVSPSLISQIERGQSRPSVATLFELARALQISVDAFFVDDEKGGDGVASAAAASGDVERGPASPVPVDEEVDDSRAADVAWPASAQDHAYVVRRNERALLDIKGGVRWERLTPTSVEPVEFLELVYQPRAESNKDLYRHPGVELVVVLEGRFEIYVGFDRFELEPGDSIAFPSSMPHRYANPTDRITRAITVIIKDDLSALSRSR